MASDPRFGNNPNRSDQTSFQTFQIDEPPRKRSFWQTCLIGCLGALGVAIVLAVIAGFWVSRHWRGWVAGVGSQAINQAIDQSDLPPQEKIEVKEQVERVTKGFGNGQISNEQAAHIFQKIIESPLMPMVVVTAVDKHYFDRSGLSEDEKRQGRVTLQRFARGVFDKKIDEKGIDSVMSHVAERKGEGDWELRRHVSDEDLRAALTEAKTRADEAKIDEAPPKVDPSDEIKRIIDESLNGKVEQDSK
jgi:hypothetical protein